MKRVKPGSIYTYQPVGMDLWAPCSRLEAGARVRVVNLPGCPKANTMGHCHVETLSGEFGGLVLVASLAK